MISHAFIHSLSAFYCSVIQGYYPGERGFLFFPFIASTKTKNEALNEGVGEQQI